MSTVQQVLVLLAAPRDVEAELNISRHLIEEWNRNEGLERGVVLQALHWRTHATPQSGNPQDILDRELVDRAHIIVAIFWTRFGEPTPTTESGTEAEIRRGIRDGKVVSIYFSRVPVDPDTLDTAEYARLKKFKDEIRDIVLYWEFHNLEEFERDFRGHLSRAVTKELARRQSGDGVADGGSVAATEEHHDETAEEFPKGRLDYQLDHNEAVEVINSLGDNLVALTDQWARDLPPLVNLARPGSRPQDVRKALKDISSYMAEQAREVLALRDRHEAAYLAIRDADTALWAMIREENDIQGAERLRDTLSGLVYQSGQFEEIVTPLDQMVSQVQGLSRELHGGSRRLRDGMRSLFASVEVASGFAASLTQQINAWLQR